MTPTSRGHRPRTRSAARLAAVVSAAALAAAGCGGEGAKPSLVQTTPVERRDIVVEAQATGTVEPVDTVAVKSKAGGLVIKLPVEIGSQVKPGDLLVQIDTRDLRNQYEQARAALAAAQAQLAAARAARDRADQLASQRVITAAEHETTTASYASAQSQVVTARTNLDIAQQKLDDATVRAQVAGTVISKPISVGTVISSATTSVGGGTTLLTIADLSRVRMRTLVNETDIGNVKVGQPATVTVDAFPDRRFNGTVEKIEPQAVVQQSVTMFPVLVSLQNSDRALLPGMNGEVTMRVQQRDNVLAVPVDAVRGTRDMATAAQALGISADSAQQLLRAQFASRSTAGGPGGSDDVQNDVGQTVPVTDSACKAVAAALGAKPALQARMDSLRQRARGGEIDFQAMRDSMQALYRQAGVDPRAAGACQRRRFASGGGSTDGAGNGGGGGGGGGGARGGFGGASGGGSSRGGSSRGGTALTRGVVFVKDSTGWSPRFVQLGVSNYDYTEVRGNVKEGDQVALLGAALLQQQRQQQNERIRSVTGGPLGGGGAGGGAGRAGGGGGGGPRGGT
jgi:HlyD family secretion protein